MHFLKTLLIHDFSVKLCKANNAFMHCWNTWSLIAIHVETPSLSSFLALRKNGDIYTHSKKQERKADILGTNFVLLKATSSRNIDKKSILSEELQTKPELTTLITKCLQLPRIGMKIAGQQTQHEPLTLLLFSKNKFFSILIKNAIHISR